MQASELLRRIQSNSAPVVVDTRSEFEFGRGHIPGAINAPLGTFYLDVEDTYRNIKDIDMVPSLSPQNLAAIEIGKDFMLSHGYIKNDFEVQKWTAPEFLEAVAKELIEERWKKVTADKLPEATALRLG